MRPRDLFMGLRGSIRGLPGVPGGQEGIQGIPWAHRVGLMSVFMIHKAYIGGLGAFFSRKLYSILDQISYTGP